MCGFLQYICSCFMKKKRNGSGSSRRTGRQERSKSSKARKTSYGTDWETQIDNVMSPSQIDDSTVTKEVIVDEQHIDDTKNLVNILFDGQYILAEEEPLGKGSYGSVYKLREKSTGEFRVVKVMNLNSSEDSISKSRFLMFKSEVFALRKNPHRNIIKLFDHSIISNLFRSFMVMEFAEGGDLMHRLSQTHNIYKRGFSETETKIYFAQIANAMNHIHSKCLIHGDLKLENILITKASNGSEIIKVTDFGCARVGYTEDEGIKKIKKVVGTVPYMAPEQLRAFLSNNLKRPDLVGGITAYNPIRADVWSLGVCLYRMLFYSFPFPYDRNSPVVSVQKMLSEMRKGFVAPQRIAREISKRCMNMISELMEYHKNKRIDMKIVMRHKWLYSSPYLDEIRLQVS